MALSVTELKRSILARDAMLREFGSVAVQVQKALDATHESEVERKALLEWVLSLFPAAPPQQDNN